ncbi:MULTISPECIES: CBS domain-containing protein [Agarivorans]|jgi:predicted transcriptional regulator|uniref:CBS domain-containing protein n=1 Tax=Agarivorans gilvus TaxID=680279 RepID=A0ABQ1HWU9_9ALTE|nr:CBS domain-containing protein [Agarivorans gilvus]GGA94747.1 CBS domain-containing protein [Agarivorans gilvus]
MSENLKVRDYMLTRPVCFTAKQAIAEVVRSLLEHKQLGAPVVDEHKHVIGWISEQDCLKSLLEATYHCETVSLVEDLMRKDVLSVGPETSIFELAQSMLLQKPKMYPVIEQGKLLGLITREEVLAGISKHLNSCYKSVS